MPRAIALAVALAVALAPALVAADAAVPDGKAAAEGKGAIPRELEVHIHFRAGTAEVVDGDRLLIEAVARAMARVPSLRVRVDGHTAARGAHEWNLRLGRQRAERVRAQLVAAGVDPARLDVESFGETRPLADNRTAEGRAFNSRVQFTVVGGGAR